MSAIPPIAPTITEKRLGAYTGLRCPLCQGELRWRMNSANKTFFMGCATFPHCTGSRDESGMVSRLTHTTNEKRVMRILKAAVMHSEEECLTFTEQELVGVEELELHIDHIQEEDSYVVTVRKP